MTTRGYLVAGIFCIFLCLYPAGTAWAHVLQTDGDIGAVLHIKPDDNPTSGTPVDYELSFTDTTGRFRLAECHCTVTILQQDRPIANLTLAASTSQLSDNTVTFPVPGVYTLEVSGSPLRAGIFQAFTLRYNIRVTGGGATTQPMPFLLMVGIALSIGLILLAAYRMEYARQKPPMKEK